MKPTFDSLESLKARAADPNTSGAELDNLLTLPVVSAIAATNPNLSELRYTDLLRKHPTEILTNPAFQLTLATSMDLMEKIIATDTSFHAALSNEHCPTAFILYALSHPTKARVQALLANPALDERYLYDIERLIRDKTISGIRLRDVRAHANHPEGGSVDPEEALLKELALAGTRVTVNYLKDVPMDYHQALLNGNGEEYARRPDLLPNQMVLAQHPDVKVRALAARSDADLSLQELLARDPETRVRIALATNPKIQLGLLEELSRDPELDVRAAVAQNRNLTFEIAARLIAEDNAEINQAIIDLPHCPPEILRQVWRRWRSSPAYANHRSNLLHNPNCPADLLDDAIRLDQERIDRVAYTPIAARHPNLSPEHFPSLARSTSVETRANLATNPNLPGEIFLLLAQDTFQRVRHAVAVNRKTPDYIRLGLQNDPDRMTRMAAGADEEPQAYYLDYSAMPNTERLALAISRQTRPQMLKWLATRADSHVVRLAVALNPSATPETIAALTKDANRTVRAAAKRQAMRTQEPQA